jgi:hypothetical protein
MPDSEPAKNGSSVAKIAALLKVWGSDPGEGFCRVEISDEFARRQVVEGLKAHLAEQKINFTELELPRNDSTSEMTLLLVDRLRATPSGVVSVTGFGAAFPLAEGLDSFLVSLNFQRERLAVEGLRQIWWLPVFIAEQFVREIPDLDSWFQLRLKLSNERPDIDSQRLAPLVPVFPHWTMPESEAFQVVVRLLKAEGFRFYSTQIRSESDLLAIQKGRSVAIHIVSHFEAVASAAAWTRQLSEDVRLEEEIFVWLGGDKDLKKLKESLFQIQRKWRQVIWTVEDLRALAIEHPKTLIGLLDLARAGRRLEEAESMVREAIEIWKKKGPALSIPYILPQLIGGLGSLLPKSHRKIEALALLEDSRVRLARLLGDRHPKTREVAALIDKIEKQ